MGLNRNIYVDLWGIEGTDRIHLLELQSEPSKTIFMISEEKRLGNIRGF